MSVLVWSELREAALELLGIGREMADRLSAPLVSLSLGSGSPEVARQHLASGADRALFEADPRLDARDSKLHVAVLAHVSAAVQPALVVVGATCHGSEVAARLAQQLGVGCASGATLLFEGGRILAERSCLGRCVARQAFHGSPAIATVGLRFLSPPIDPRSGSPEEISLDLPTSAIRVLGSRPRVRSAVAIDRAKVVVSVGRGLRRLEDLALVEDLAAALGGVVGASRPLTDHLGWLPSDLKVGLSGRTVAPELYVACGISGQIEHLVGMRGSRVVVAINADPSAPIMQEADYCLVGDLYQLVPALARALRASAAV